MNSKITFSVWQLLVLIGGVLLMAVGEVEMFRYFGWAYNTTPVWEVGAVFAAFGGGIIWCILFWDKLKVWGKPSKEAKKQ